MAIRYRLNIQDINRSTTMAEQLELARLSGMTINEARMVESGDFGNLPMSAMIAIVYILIRRIDPRFSEADMAKLDWEEIEFVSPTAGHDGAADPPQPLQPLKSGGRKSSARSAATTA